MIWSIARFQKAGHLYIPVLKSAAFILVPLSLGIWGLKYGVSSLHHLRFQSPTDFPMSVVISMGLGAFIFDTLMGLLWLVVAVHATAFAFKAHTEVSMGSLFRESHQTLIEDLRKTMSVLLWSLAFIIPGIFRWIRLTFTCFVSLLNPSYQEGKIDALEKSSQLVKGHGIAIALLLLAHLGVTSGLEEIGSRFAAFSIPLFFFYGLAWMVSLFFAIYMTLTYAALDPEVTL